MTRLEAQEICAALTAGRSFATRHQEEEWGLVSRRDGRFEKWSHRLLQEGGEESSRDILSEEQVIELLVTWYSYDRIKAGLR
jgi:hypothetical protein